MKHQEAAASRHSDPFAPSSGGEAAEPEKPWDTRIVHDQSVCEGKRTT